MTAAASNVSSIPAPPPRKPRKKAASVAAREAEAGDGFLTVEHCGVTLRVPSRGAMSIVAMDAFRAGDNYGGTKEILGAEQWKQLRDAGMTVDGLNELAAKIREAWGN